MRTWVRRTIISGGIVLALAAGGALATFRLYTYPSGSMAPTFVTGQLLLVNRLSYRLGGSPRRGEIVVYAGPNDPDKDFVKRVVAVGGDTLAIKGEQITVNGKPVPRKALAGRCEYEDLDEEGNTAKRACRAFEERLGDVVYSVIQERDPAWKADGAPPLRVPAAHVYVIGDNRDNSFDSRIYGPVPLTSIRGRVMQ